MNGLLLVLFTFISLLINGLMTYGAYKLISSFLKKSKEKKNINFSQKKEIKLPYDSTPLKDPKILSLRDKALKGDVESQYLLGLYYLIGKYCDKNESMAFQWIEVAARNGHPEASVKEALLYLYGVGVEEDISQGRSYLMALAVTGNNEALQELKNHFPNIDWESKINLIREQKSMPLS